MRLVSESPWAVIAVGEFQRAVMQARIIHVDLAEPGNPGQKYSLVP
jgi:hypothetical protein